jgi:transposase
LGYRPLGYTFAKTGGAVNGGRSELHPKSWTRKSTKGVQKSMGKELFSEELKLAVVQYVLEGHTRKEASEKFCVSCTPIEKWVNLYKLHGAKGLLSRNLVGRQKGFDGEFRLKVLQYKQEHHLSCTQTAMHFCLDVVTVCRWEKKFQKEGAQERDKVCFQTGKTQSHQLPISDSAFPHGNL